MACSYWLLVTQLIRLKLAIHDIILASLKYCFSHIIIVQILLHVMSGLRIVSAEVKT